MKEITPRRVTQEQPGYWIVEKKGWLWGWNRESRLGFHTRDEAIEVARMFIQREAHQRISFPVDLSKAYKPRTNPIPQPDPDQ